MKDLKPLQHFLGSYRGNGINHEGEAFSGHFQLTELLDGKGYQIQFSAKSTDERQILFHIEHSTLAPTMSGGISLFNLNSNVPFLCEHQMIENSSSETGLKMKFRFGHLSDEKTFREEIDLELTAQTVLYRYSWGLPGGAFARRSEAVMKKHRNLSTL